jgi:hypothetical protein
MIQLWFNTAMGCYEVFVNGAQVNIISIRIDSATFGLPAVTINALAEIVNERPEK